MNEATNIRKRDLLNSTIAGMKKKYDVFNKKRNVMSSIIHYLYSKGQLVKYVTSGNLLKHSYRNVTIEDPFSFMLINSYSKIQKYLESLTSY